MSERKEHKPKQITHVDELIAYRLREKRKIVGLTQKQAAARLQITYQQYCKYENGRNRISASRLYDIAMVFEVPVTEFYDQLTPSEIRDIKIEHTNNFQLVRNYNAIHNKAWRDAISHLISVMARPEKTTP